MQIPEKLKGFKGYDENNEMIGVASVDLPELAFMSETIKGAGIAGEIDSPTMGLMQSMTVTINWHSLVDDNIVFITPKARLFYFAGSVQIYNELLGEYTSKQVLVAVKCVPKKISSGKFDVGTVMGTSGEFEVIYLKISIDGREIVEVDKYNYICKIAGVDYLEKVRKDMLMV